LLFHDAFRRDRAGGRETPVAIAAGSEMTVDFNAAALANRIDIVFLFLTGESVG
jgi:hypothetical protein